jgi:hypothetical protein
MTILFDTDTTSRDKKKKICEVIFTCSRSKSLMLVTTKVRCLMKIA